MLEITGDDILKLRDDDLRSLIGLLCEAELRSKNLPVSGVTWGGHQDAKDGGIDVQVKLEGLTEALDFIPRAMTGFQVKKPAMAAGEIIKEMCPNGVLRESIKELAKQDGAYIIVSSKSSVSKIALDDRNNAMRKALEGLEEKDNLHTDFLSRDRVATWVRYYPAIVMWIREKIGNPILGWQPYRDWSKRNDDTSTEYFIDDKIRIYFETAGRKSEISILDAIGQIRKILAESQKSVRLVGLSGVGKTRLLQALFDERIGEVPLNKSHVIYTDKGMPQDPPPILFAQQLVAFNEPIILAVDNCLPSLHSKLTQVVTGSKISLITVEYDIQDEESEETEVFRLESSSDALIVKILQSDFPHINHENKWKIAEYSGGNARIAIAISKTFSEGQGSIALRRGELFDRLFQQRNEGNKSLKRSGAVCSLLYSFSVEVKEGEDDELLLLSQLAGKSKLDFYDDIAELKRRDLVQERGRWRAVLPPPIANKLAVHALGSIPLKTLAETFESKTYRLLKSFSNRLSFLFQDENAKQIVNRWLSVKGLLGNLNSLDTYELILFKNIALVSPEMTLSAIERALGTKGGDKFPRGYNAEYYIKLVNAIAYDETLFTRCINVLVQFRLLDSSKNQLIETYIKSMFYIKHSRTRTPLEFRISVANNYLQSDNNEKRYLGLVMLKGLLETRIERAVRGLNEGNKGLRDSGWYPQTDEDVSLWYSTVLKFCKTLLSVPGYLCVNTEIVLARSLSGLWVNAKSGFYEILEEVLKEIAKEKLWSDGWIAIRQTLRYYGKKMSSVEIERLQKLHKYFEPKTTTDLVRVFVLSNDAEYDGLLDPEDEDDQLKWETIWAKTKELGIQVAKSEELFKEILPELIGSFYSRGRRMDFFCEAIAINCQSPLSIWGDLISEFVSSPGPYNYKVLYSFIRGVFQRDPNQSAKMLDDILYNETLCQKYPLIQSGVQEDPNRWARFRESLDLGKIEIKEYSSLAFSNLQEDFDSFTDILAILIKKDGGLIVAIEVLYTCVFNRNTIFKKSPSPRIKQFTRNLLTKIDFNTPFKTRRNIGHFLKNIIEGSFDEGPCEEGKIFCENLAQSKSHHGLGGNGFNETIKSLAKHQSIHYLNNLVMGQIETGRVWTSGEGAKYWFSEHAISFVDMETLINWCDGDPEIRYPVIAALTQLFKRDANGEITSFSDKAIQILERAPNQNKIIKAFTKIFLPSPFMNTDAQFMFGQLELLGDIETEDNDTLKNWVEEMKREVEKRMSKLEENEKERSQNYDQRFE